ncbi:TetR/AcrR family transcriptional regulator [Amycolatopsis sp. SID8362]|uniref:TetR/AcrR family transcriptional regulator n=1 Tax=Amycolatopsis sp. SID8362 TaxID=2690346 RepID=UPI00136BFC54|nr:TetR/AcrR family transcriptional regulator [Amycolatopsis sp. SID8362]NBH12148.1 TetR family transcriptional regulator [Amycolatopsis sp. SID8362]NED48840.1 TetR/AcrR family transcriptional regulator [Amycolatopsis sp. SID8362]
MESSHRRPRADAVRNVERLAGAARDVYVEQGPGAPLEEIARRANVATSTLFRHFPDRQALIRAALQQTYAVRLASELERCKADDNPRRALVDALEAAMGLVSSEHALLIAASEAGLQAVEAGSELAETVIELARRAQDAGAVRDDLVPEDIPRILMMLVSVHATMAPNSDGWRRYLALMLDAIAPRQTHPLPPPVPFVRPAMRV